MPACDGKGERHGSGLGALHRLEAAGRRPRGRLGKQQSSGAIDSFEPCFLSPHGGDLGGFILVRGERARLAGLRSSEEFEELVSRCLVNVDGFDVVEAYVGEGVARQMQRYTKNIRR